MTGLTAVHTVLPLRKEERVGNRVYNGLCNILLLLKNMEANTTNADICNTGQWVHGLLPSASLCFCCAEEKQVSVDLTEFQAVSQVISRNK